MFNRLDRILKKLSRFLMPGVILRADQGMLRRWPLLWRSRLWPLSWYALMAWTCCLGLGFIVPMDASTAWTGSQIGNATALIQIMGVIAAIYWVRLTLRYHISALDLWRFLRTAACYAIGIGIVLLPALTFNAVITYRVSEVVSDDQYQADWEFHERHGFWCCTDKIDQYRYDAVQNDLRKSLRRYGLTTDGSIAETFKMERTYRTNIPCPAPLSSCLSIRDTEHRMRPRLLRERLESIGASKQIHDLGWTGFLLHKIDPATNPALWLAVAAGAILAVLSAPAWQRERFLGQRVRKRKQGRRSWLPAKLRRLDRHLLLNVPMLWATRLHVFLFHSFTIGLGAIAIIFRAIELSGYTLDNLIRSLVEHIPVNRDVQHEYILLIFMLLIAIGPILWAYSTRRYRIPAIYPGQWMRLTGSFFLAAMPLPLIFIAMYIIESIGGGSSKYTWSILLLLFWPAVSLVVAGKIVYNYTTPGMTLSAIIVGNSMFFGPIALAQIIGGPVGNVVRTFIFCFPLAIWVTGTLLLWYQGRSMHAIKHRYHQPAAAILIGMIPGAALAAVVAIIFIMDSYFGLENQINNWIVGAAFFIVTIIGFTWGLSRCLSVIVRANNRPQVE